MFKTIYGRIWPIVFLAFGVFAASGAHWHFEVWGLSINLHNLMWFVMAAAHADKFWPRRLQPVEAGDSASK